MGSFYVIGDVHGCFYELLLLVDRLHLGADDTVVLVGDYVDRGPCSRQVLEGLIDLSSMCRLVPLLGNHENMFLEFIRDPFSPDAALFLYNGGGATLASYADDRGNYTIPDVHIDFLRGLKLWHETEDYFVVHAGVPEIPLDQLDADEHRDEMLWTREMRESFYEWSKLVVHGHTRADEVVILPNQINVDTGCAYDNRLSAVELPSRRVVSVPRLRREPPPLLRDVHGRRSAMRFVGAVKVRVLRHGQGHDFETVNYSQTGMLLRATGDSAATVIDEGELVHGVVGAGSPSAVAFSGVIVRRVTKSDGVYFGVKILAPDGADDPDLTARGLPNAED